MKFKHAYNFEMTPECIEAENNEPSLTVPDMAFTVRELLNKYTTGSMPPVQKNGQWSENPETEEPIPMDIDLADVVLAREEEYRLKLKLKSLQAEAIKKKKAGTIARAKELSEKKVTDNSLENSGSNE